jgi:hypothetical protein
MPPMRPAKRPTAETGRLDTVIQQIETDLPAVHRLCTAMGKQKKSPIERLNPESKTRLRELSQDPIMNDEGTDILETPMIKINGYHTD